MPPYHCFLFLFIQYAILSGRNFLEANNLKSCCVFSWEGELLWQSLIGRGPRHAIPIFLLENHMVGLIRFVTVHDSAMQSRLPFSSVLPHFCTRNFCGLKKVQFFYLAFNQLHLIVTLAHYMYQLYFSTLYVTVESPQSSELIQKSIIELILFWEWTC